MKKYTIDITSSGVTSASGVTTFKRSTSPSNGITVNSTNFAIADWSSRDLSKFKYNALLYKPGLRGGRAVEMLPGSTAGNTVISTDGLVGVVYQVSSLYYIAVLDLFDTGVTAVGSIQPVDYTALQSYVYGNNPEHVRVFAARRDSASDYFKLSNDPVYTEVVSGTRYTSFRSERDYALTGGVSLDSYGYYRVAESSFNSTYAETDEFNFFKKQFFVITGPSNLVVYAFDGSSYVEKLPISGTNAYWFDSTITGETDLLRLKFKHASDLAATIRVR